MTREELLRVFPEINVVPNEELKEKCIETWLDVLEVGGWDEKGIENCPLAVGPVAANCPEKCIDHCRHVVQLCKSYLDTMGAWCNEIGHLDPEIFLTAAVLHDVGKFLEYDFRDGKPCHSENGEMFKHVTSGAYYAKKHGLPDKVVYAILAHSEALSPENGNAVPSMELTIMRTLDFLTYSLAAMNYPG